MCGIHSFARSSISGRLRTVSMSTGHEGPTIARSRDRAIDGRKSAVAPAAAEGNRSGRGTCALDSSGETRDALCHYLVVSDDERVACERNEGRRFPVQVCEVSMDILTRHCHCLEQFRRRLCKEVIEESADRDKTGQRSVWGEQDRLFDVVLHDGFNTLAKCLQMVSKRCLR